MKRSIVLDSKEVNDETLPYVIAEIGHPPPVPSTAIYSKTDGVAAWRACRENKDAPQTDNIEVISSHIGLGFNPAVMFAVADRLALPADKFTPFHRLGWRGLTYPKPAQPPVA